MRILADRVAYRGLRYVSSRHAVPDQAITFGWLSLLTAGGLAAGVSQPVWPVNFRRTASISRLADTLSPAMTPPPSIGMVMSMPKSRRLICAVA